MKTSNIWLGIILVGLLLFGYGVIFNHEFEGGLGALTSVSAFFCWLSEWLIKIIRHKRGKRWK